MIDNSFVRGAISVTTAFVAASIIMLGKPNPDKPRIHIGTATTPIGNHTPVWAKCITPIEDSVLQTTLPPYRSSAPFRGYAAAAIMRPSAVLATYHMQHHQNGPELNNLTTALQALDKLLVPPGSEFSFNQIVGPRQESRGYRQGLMYSQGKVVTGVGGGVCVASTALYNAALMAGLPVLERFMHSGPTSYAAPTRDAAVVFGSKDLRIKNNTDMPLWILTSVLKGEARISLLSYHKPPFQVVLREEGPSFIPAPLKIEQAASGKDIEVIQAGTAGCNRKLVREFWQDGKLLKQELICKDVRSPLPRIIGLPIALGGSIMEAPSELAQPVLPSPKLPDKYTSQDASPEIITPDLPLPEPGK